MSTRRLARLLWLDARLLRNSEEDGFCSTRRFWIASAASYASRAPCEVAGSAQQGTEAVVAHCQFVLVVGDGGVLLDQTLLDRQRGLVRLPRPLEVADCR